MGITIIDATQIAGPVVEITFSEDITWTGDSFSDYNFLMFDGTGIWVPIQIIAQSASNAFRVTNEDSLTTPVKLIILDQLEYLSGSQPFAVAGPQTAIS